MKTALDYLRIGLATTPGMLILAALALWWAGG